jgi:carboxypeptidase family protein
MKKTLAFFLLAGSLSAASCGGASPVAPDAARLVIPTISGQVHESVTWGDPPLAAAVVEVTGGDGSKKTGISDDRGFYKIAVGPGNVTVTASKPGFETKTSEFLLVTDTVLNFSLAPE